jgi:predicted DNA-binding protein (UPF0251 family)
MEQITSPEAAKRKGCSRQAIWWAIRRKELDAVQIGRAYIIKVNGKFLEWKPNLVRQEAGLINRQKAK